MKRNPTPRSIVFLTATFLFFGGGPGMLTRPCQATEASDSASDDAISKEAELSEHERATIHDMLTQSAAEPMRSPAVVETLPPPPDEIDLLPSAPSEDSSSSGE